MGVKNVSSCLQQCKNYKNRVCSSRVMITNVLHVFFGPQCIVLLLHMCVNEDASVVGLLTKAWVDDVQVQQKSDEEQAQVHIPVAKREDTGCHRDQPIRRGYGPCQRRALACLFVSLVSCPPEASTLWRSAFLHGHGTGVTQRPLLAMQQNRYFIRVCVCI